MTGGTERLVDLVGQSGTEVVAAIADEVLRGRVVAGLSACATALGVLDDLDLEQYEMVDLGLPDLSVWNAAAPAVRNVLLVVHESIEELADEFPSAAAPRTEPEVGDELTDAMFASMEDGSSDLVRVEIDSIVVHAAEARVGETVATLTGMLKEELDGFGRRLRSPKVVADRWYLLGELQEFRNKCTKCLEAIAATILTVFGGAELDDVLPRYGTEAKRGADLRAIVTDMRYDLRRVKGDLEHADTATAQKLRVAIGDMLRRFCDASAFRTMRALDKRELIVFRLKVANWTPVESTLEELRDAVEGFDKHLELMRGLNRRREVAREDEQHLEIARAALVAGKTNAAIAHLERVYGRFDELDDWLRVQQAGANPPVEALPELIQMALAATALV